MNGDSQRPQVEIVWSHAPRSAFTLNFDWLEGQTLLQALCVHQDPLDQVLKLKPENQSHTPWDELNLRLHLEDLKSLGALFLSIWGHPCQLDTVLKPQDRIELSLALKVDPKVARRERFQAQGAKGAGLFAKKRPGAKSGY